MTAQEWYRHLIEDVIDAEKVILSVMIAMSAYMLWDTTHFDIASAMRFPRLAGGVVFVGSVLLFLRGYLPDRIERLILSEGSAFEANEEFTEREEAMEAGGQTESETGSVSTVDRSIHDSIFTSLAVVGYALLGYAVGLIWASPLFVVVYARWYRIDWLRTVALAVIGFVIAYSFMVVLNVPMDAGKVFLQEGAPWLPS